MQVVGAESHDLHFSGLWMRKCAELWVSLRLSVHWGLFWKPALPVMEHVVESKEWKDKGLMLGPIRVRTSYMQF